MAPGMPDRAPFASPFGAPPRAPSKRQTSQPFTAGALHRSRVRFAVLSSGFKSGPRHFRFIVAGASGTWASWKASPSAQFVFFEEAGL